jgi:hypothetical protein
MIILENAFLTKFKEQTQHTWINPKTQQEVIFYKQSCLLSFKNKTASKKFSKLWVDYAGKEPIQTTLELTNVKLGLNNYKTKDGRYGSSWEMYGWDNAEFWEFQEKVENEIVSKERATELATITFEKAPTQETTDEVEVDWVGK